MVSAHEPGVEQHVDVLIVGAGLSGIAAAYHLQQRCPDRSYAILEARQAIGGTWDLFRYPGVRSDSDMFTLGYSFRPWGSGATFADGAAIRDYIESTAKAFGIDQHIRFGHRMVRAAWSSESGTWTVTVERTGQSPTRITCSFLYACTGYYTYDRGHSPTWPGQESFEGQIVHPQHWPQDLDWTDQRVVVVGSGATAVSLIPALTERAAHVTMLQRTPSYVVPQPGQDRLAHAAHRALPTSLAHRLVRWRNIGRQMFWYQLSRWRPQLMRRLIGLARKQVLTDLGAAEPDHLDAHFDPPYDPWDQRLCVAPDGDLFRELQSGRASVVTDQLTSFTKDGLTLASGEHLAADLVVTATGLRLKLLDGVALVVDGEPVRLADTMTYRGVMCSGVPNLAASLGYTNASWTLRCELVAAHVCRLLQHMDQHGFTTCMPEAGEPSEEPLLSLTSTYVKRAADELPRQGTRAPWRIHQNYLVDLWAFSGDGSSSGALAFSTAPNRVTRPV